MSSKIANMIGHSKSNIPSDFLKKYSLKNSKIYGQLERLQYSSNGTDSFSLLQGWLLTEQGPIEKLIFSFPGLLYQEVTPYFRRDIVELSRNHPFSIFCGFKLRIDLNIQALCRKGINPDITIVLKNGDRLEIKLSALKKKRSRVPRFNVSSIQKSLITQLKSELKDFLKKRNFLNVPFFKRPQVSIVILSYENPHLLFKCVSQVVKNTSCAYEIIIVDNASGLSTTKLLSRIKTTRIIKNKKNMHFVVGANQGARFAKSKYVLFLNSDCFVDRSAIDNALSLIAANPKIGVVGAKLQHPTGLIFESGIVIHENSGKTEFLGSELHMDNPNFNGVSVVDSISGAFFLTEKKLFKKLNGFDRRFRPAYFEDADFCLRARNSGRIICVNSQSIALHIGGGSSKLGPSNSLEKNRKIYIERSFSMPVERIRHVGVNVVGVLSNRTKIGHSVSTIISILKNQKISVIPNLIFDDKRDCLKHLNELKWKTNPFQINLIQLNPQSLPLVPKFFGSNFFNHKYNIYFDFTGQCYNEDDLRRIVEYFDEIWTVSSSLQKILNSHTKKPVIYLKKIPISHHGKLKTQSTGSVMASRIRLVYNLL